MIKLLVVVDEYSCIHPVDDIISSWMEDKIDFLNGLMKSS
jgi:hypothetical protein